MPWEKTEEYIRSGHNDPSKYDRMRTIVISASQGIKAVYGHVKGGDRWEVQSYLFAIAKGWTMDKAKAWFSSHKDSQDPALNAATVEPAKVTVSDNWTSIPVTLTKEGVMNGLYKPADVIRALGDKPVVAIPVVIDHPDQMDPVIREPELVVGFTNQHEVHETDKGPAYRGVLHLMNVPDTEPERNALRQGKPLGVSIGYFRELNEGAGEWNGVAYNGIERDVVPFHLGIMREMKPACTVADGCGAGVDSASNHGRDNMPDGEPKLAELSLDALTAQNACAKKLKEAHDTLIAEHNALKEQMAKLVSEKTELEKAAVELNQRKEAERNARIEALLKTAGDKLKKEDIASATNEELARFEKVFQAANLSLNATGGDAADTPLDPNRLLGKPMATSK